MPAGYVYHVLNRGNDWQVLFREDADFVDFMALLVFGAIKFGVRICCYSLMRNHWHLLVWPLRDGAVSAFMHWVTTTHSLRYRRQYGTVGNGHVYQGRFRSFPVQTERYYFNALRYVEANALRAHLVRRAEDWRWCSLHDRLRTVQLMGHGPLVLPPDWVDIVNAPQEGTELEAIRACVGKGRPYGEERWVATTAAEQFIEQTLRPRGRPTRGT
jgi:putative transposase